MSEKYGDERRQRIFGSESAQSSSYHVHPNSREIRQWARCRVYRGVFHRILEAGFQQVGAVERSTGYARKFSLITFNPFLTLLHFFHDKEWNRYFLGVKSTPKKNGYS